MTTPVVSTYTAPRCSRSPGPPATSRWSSSIGPRPRARPGQGVGAVKVEDHPAATTYVCLGVQGDLDPEAAPEGNRGPQGVARSPTRRSGSRTARPAEARLPRPDDAQGSAPLGGPDPRQGRARRPPRPIPRAPPPSPDGPGGRIVGTTVRTGPGGSLEVGRPLKSAGPSWRIRSRACGLRGPARRPEAPASSPPSDTPPGSDEPAYDPGPTPGGPRPVDQDEAQDAPHPRSDRHGCLFPMAAQGSGPRPPRLHDWLAAEQELLFGLNYEVLARHRLDGVGPHPPRDHEDDRRCRFCEQTAPRAVLRRAPARAPGEPGESGLDVPSRSATTATSSSVESLAFDLDWFVQATRFGDESRSLCYVPVAAFKGLARAGLAPPARGRNSSSSRTRSSGSATPTTSSTAGPSAASSATSTPCPSPPHSPGPRSLRRVEDDEADALHPGLLRRRESRLPGRPSPSPPGTRTWTASRPSRSVASPFGVGPGAAGQPTGRGHRPVVRRAPARYDPGSARAGESDPPPWDSIAEARPDAWASSACLIARLDPGRAARGLQARGLEPLPHP